MFESSGLSIAAPFAIEVVGLLMFANVVSIVVAFGLTAALYEADRRIDRLMQTRFGRAESVRWSEAMGYMAFFLIVPLATVSPMLAIRQMWEMADPLDLLNDFRTWVTFAVVPATWVVVGFLASERGPNGLDQAPTVVSSNCWASTCRLVFRPPPAVSKHMDLPSPCVIHPS